MFSGEAGDGRRVGGVLPCGDVVGCDGAVGGRRHAAGRLLPVEGGRAALLLGHGLPAAGARIRDRLELVVVVGPGRGRDRHAATHPAVLLHLQPHGLRQLHGLPAGEYRMIFLLIFMRLTTFCENWICWGVKNKMFLLF